MISIGLNHSVDVGKEFRAEKRVSGRQLVILELVVENMLNLFLYGSAKTTIPAKGKLKEAIKIVGECCHLVDGAWYLSDNFLLFVRPARMRALFLPLLLVAVQMGPQYHSVLLSRWDCKGRS
jgi:hypothetical protein